MLTVKIYPLMPVINSQWKYLNLFALTLAFYITLEWCFIVSFTLALTLKKHQEGTMQHLRHGIKSLGKFTILSQFKIRGVERV